MALLSYLHRAESPGKDFSVFWVKGNIGRNEGITERKEEKIGRNKGIIGRKEGIQEWRNKGTRKQENKGTREGGNEGIKGRQNQQGSKRREEWRKE